jgi:hypothetical protein
LGVGDAPNSRTSSPQSSGAGGRPDFKPNESSAAAKARGKKLGGNRGVKLSPTAREAGRAELVKRANARAAELVPTIAEIQQAGHCTG